MAGSIRRGLLARSLPAVLVGLLLGGERADARVVLDYTAVGGLRQSFHYNDCGVGVRAHADATLATSADMAVNAAARGPGIAGEGHEDLSAPFISGAQRLANGNTLVCSGTGGEFFEVTRAGEVVWEYRSPFSGGVRNADGSLPQAGLDENPYAVFRATRTPADHPALAGWRLAPLDPQPPWFDSRKQARAPAADAT